MKLFRQLYWASPGYETGLAGAFEELFDGVVTLSDQTINNLSSNDIVLFDGGTDIDPEFYGEHKHPFTQMADKMRDERERVFFRRAQSVGAGCLGVCRGAQLLCALSGGKLFQHVTGHEGPRAHVVHCDDGIERLAHGDHHQMMFPSTAHDYKILAWANNLATAHCEYGKEIEHGIEPEIVWFPHTKSLAIQPHPEWMKYDMMFPLYCRNLVFQYLLRD